VVRPTKLATTPATTDAGARMSSGRPDYQQASHSARGRGGLLNARVTRASRVGGPCSEPDDRQEGSRTRSGYSQPACRCRRGRETPARAGADRGCWPPARPPGRGRGPRPASAAAAVCGVARRTRRRRTRSRVSARWPGCRVRRRRARGSADTCPLTRRVRPGGSAAGPPPATSPTVVTDLPTRSSVCCPSPFLQVDRRSAAADPDRAHVVHSAVAAFSASGPVAAVVTCCLRAPLGS
jgi:hypothetical protein